MDDLQPPTDADWAAALGDGPAMSQPDFMSATMDYQPPGLGAPASSVSPVEPSADPWPPVPGDNFGPPAQLAAPVAPAPTMPAIPPGAAPVAQPGPSHPQMSQTVRSVTPAPGEAEAIDRANASAREAAAAQGEADRLATGGKEAKAQALEDKAIQDRLDQQEADDKQAELQAKEAEARAKYDAAEQEAANFKFHESPRANSISAKLARAFGSFNLSGNYSHNEAAERIQHEIDRDFDQQKLELLSKQNIAKWRKEGVTDANARLKEEMGALYLRQAKMHDAVAAKAEAMAIRAGIPADEAQASATVKKNIAAADKARAEALKAFRGSVSTTYAAPAKGKGTPEGGGSGKNIASFVDAVNALKPGDKVTPEIYELGRKAGYKSNQIGAEVDRIRQTGFKSTTAEGNAGKAGQEDVKDVDKLADSYNREINSPKGPGTQYARLKAMGNLVSHAIASGDKTAATSVLEEAGGMLSGGKSTKNTVELLEKLKASRDELSEKWGHITGDPGASKAYTQRLNDLLNRVRQEKKDEISDVYNRYMNETMGEYGIAREGKRKERAMGRAALFGDVAGKQEAPASGGLPPGAIPGRSKSTGKRGYMLDGVFHATE